MIPPKNLPLEDLRRLEKEEKEEFRIALLNMESRARYEKSLRKRGWKNNDFYA